MAPAPPSPSAIVCVFEKLSNFHLFCGSRNIREMKPFFGTVIDSSFIPPTPLCAYEGRMHCKQIKQRFHIHDFLGCCGIPTFCSASKSMSPPLFYCCIFFLSPQHRRHFCVIAPLLRRVRKRERGRQNGSITSHRNRPSLLLPLVTVMEEGLRSINACAEKKKNRGGIL